MQPTIHCKGFELTKAIRDAVESRLGKVATRTHGISLKTSLEKETDETYRVHIEYVTAHEGVLNATAKGVDLYKVIHDARDKLIRQLNDKRGREETKHRGPKIGEHLPE